MSPAALLALASAVLLGWVWVRNQPPSQRKAAIIKILLFGAAAGLIFLAATGRLHLVGALLAVMLPFVRRLWPLLLGLFLRRRTGQGNTTGNSGGRSRVATAIIDMTLEHDSGVMYGTVLAGPLQGKELAELSDEQFIELLQYCRREDTDSARLLETYLDKRFGDKWRADDPGATEQETHDQSAGGASNGPMTRAEALEILGLNADATREDIIHAHRRLMQKMHPDRGGSAYLAARINAARTLLLD